MQPEPRSLCGCEKAAGRIQNQHGDLHTSSRWDKRWREGGGRDQAEAGPGAAGPASLRRWVWTWPLGGRGWRGRERSWEATRISRSELPVPCWLSHPHPMLRLGLGPRAKKKPGRETPQKLV